MKDKDFIYIDGKIVSQEMGLFSGKNRAISLGESLFTTCRRLKNGVIPGLTLHFERFFKGCHYLYSEYLCSFDDFKVQVKEALDIVLAHCDEQKFADSSIRITAFLNSDDRSLVPSSGELLFYISVNQIHSCFSSVTPIKLGVGRVPLQLSSRPPYLKTGNYLDRIIELRNAKKLGFDEVLFLDSDGFIAECTTSNICFINGKTIYSPNLSSAVLDGITQRSFLNFATKNGYQHQQGNFLLSDLNEVDFVLISNSIKGISPVEQVGENRLKAIAPDYLKLINDFSSLYLEGRLDG